MISVIMPVFNGARFMDRAIASVVAQTSPAWELIIIDDGSEDDSLERARRWQRLINDHAGEEKIIVFSTGGCNSGPQIGRNLAAQRARYNFFAYLDQDDLYFPHRVESLLPFIDQSDLVFAPYEIYENGRVRLWNIRALWEKSSYLCSSEGEREPPFDVWARVCLEKGELSVPLGVGHRREIFEQVGGFQPGIIVGMSGVLWRRIANRGARIGFCPAVAGRYNVHRDSLARTRQPFSTGGFLLQKDHPLGSNGQYLDEGWFTALEKRHV